MKVHCYLIVSASGSIRTVKNRTKVAQNEVEIEVKLDLPDALFKRPKFSAELIVPEEAVQPNSITVETTNEIAKSIKAATGLDLKITIGPEETPAE